MPNELTDLYASLAADTPSGRVWYRYSFDGYGEKPTGAPWDFSGNTKGRPWPLLDWGSGHDASGWVASATGAVRSPLGDRGQSIVGA